VRYKDGTEEKFQGKDLVGWDKKEGEGGRRVKYSLNVHPRPTYYCYY